MQSLLGSEPTAQWDLSLRGGKHKVEFEHSGTTGRRVVRVDGREVVRKDWMFKLVGKEAFRVEDVACEIKINSESGFSFNYHLLVAGKEHARFAQQRSEIQRTWLVTSARPQPGENQDGAAHGGVPCCRVVLEKTTMDVWCNGKRLGEDVARREFVEDGAEIRFQLPDGREAALRGGVVGSDGEGGGGGKEGGGSMKGRKFVYDLFVEQQRIEPDQPTINTSQ